MPHISYKCKLYVGESIKKNGSNGSLKITCLLLTGIQKLTQRQENIYIFVSIILLNSHHPWKFCQFWIVELQSRTDHLKLGKYVRNVDMMGSHFCMVRQCRSMATIQTHLSPVNYRNLFSTLLTTDVFATDVYHWLPIHSNRCWHTPPSSLPLLFALLSHAATSTLSVLDCTSKSTTKFLVPCVISSFCHLDDIRTAKNHNDLAVFIWISVFNENIRVIMTHRTKGTGIL